MISTRKDFLKSSLAFVPVAMVAGSDDDELIVYELSSCSEYWMQYSEGLFHTPEAALTSLGDLEVLRIEKIGDGLEQSWIIVIRDEFDAATRDTKPDINMPREEFFASLRHFGFYKWTHAGYDILSIAPRTVRRAT